MELNSPPCISHRDRKFSASEEQILNTEIQKLMKKEVLEIARPEKGQVISPIFLTPKPDGSYRMILNLKQFNEHVTYHHFKMETLHTITSLMERNCFMASLDIKDAYYSVEVASEHRKYFRFEFNDNLLEYKALPNGLACCPRVFTKLLKPALTELHKEGIIATAYIDDLYLQGENFNDCLSNVIRTTKLLLALGFIVHPEKSSFIPSQEIKMLGFILNSKTMTAKPTQQKIESVLAVCQNCSAKRSRPLEVARKHSALWSLVSPAFFMGRFITVS